ARNTTIRAIRPHARHWAIRFASGESGCRAGCERRLAMKSLPFVVLQGAASLPPPAVACRGGTTGHGYEQATSLFHIAPRFLDLLGMLLGGLDELIHARRAAELVGFAADDPG